MNFLIILAAAFVPMIVGFIWYNPKVMGNAWMEATGLTDEKMKGANMPLIYGLSFVCALMLSISMYSIVIHQAGVNSIFVGLGADDQAYLADFMAKYGTLYRTFKHGVLHGVIGGLFIALPILATNAMFERKSFKYVAINVGYWTITMALMGGIICQWA